MISVSSAYASTGSNVVGSSGTSTPQAQVCQRCRLPLRLHEPMIDMDGTAFDQILSSSAPVRGDEQKLKADVKQGYPSLQLDHYQALSSVNATNGNGDPDLMIRPRRASNHRASGYLSRSSTIPTESFVLLTESQVVNAQPQANHDNHEQIGGYEAMIRDASNKGKDDVSGADSDERKRNEDDAEIYPLSNRFKTSDRIFDIVTSKTDLDQPICSECLELLVEGLKQQYIEIVRDRDAYAAFLKQVQSEIPSAEEQAAAEKELAEISRQQDEVIAELRKTEEERKKVEAEIEELEKQSKQLSKEEEQFWTTRNKFSQELENFLNERDAVKMQYAHDSELLEKLKRTNVYSDIIAIEGGSAALDRMAGVSGRR
ncbi:autophagy protein Apg6-domain-containing protein [Lipomyces kononenkoae]|uniref:Autophagy protein Apg6-domain-containing protein n=1 Tax=Lipomyces kononenkoae TaxID=34357 RepID=A0ACC3T9D2_LIPKO